jgi:hypothetical protein
MPNWCANTLTLSHSDPKMITRAKDAFARGEFLNEFVPVPKELQIVAGSVSDPKEQTELVKQQEANKKKYGYANWYDFCIGEWSTKWDVGDSQGINSWTDTDLVVYFDSAWSPPIQAYDSLVNQGFTVYATYYEPGCAFAGIYEDGIDDYYDLSGMDSGDVQQQLPQELDDAFGISESMAEYEAENEDEVTQWYKEGVEATGLTPHEKPVDK